MGRDRRIIDESIGGWLAKMIFMMVLMIAFGLGGTYIAKTSGIGHLIGIATAIILSEIWRLDGLYERIADDFRNPDKRKINPGNLPAENLPAENLPAENLPKEEPVKGAKDDKRKN